MDIQPSRRRVSSRYMSPYDVLRLVGIDLECKKGRRASFWLDQQHGWLYDHFCRESKKLLAAMHPDRGGSHDDFVAVKAQLDKLKGAFEKRGFAGDVSLRAAIKEEDYKERRIKVQGKKDGRYTKPRLRRDAAMSMVLAGMHNAAIAEKTGYSRQSVAAIRKETPHNPPCACGRHGGHRGDCHGQLNRLSARA